MTQFAAAQRVADQLAPFVAQLESAANTAAASSDQLERIRGNELSFAVNSVRQAIDALNRAYATPTQAGTPPAPLSSAGHWVWVAS